MSEPRELIPAAQYIRMSTEHQRFSPDNQKMAMAAYALAHGYEIVKTYQDLGKSGLTLKNRAGLKRLLGDVLSGEADFKAILVLDVSRWGRFQDADQAAHYEYVCREAGIPVRYCSEAFDNDGGSMSSIIKHLRRVMAAEYSADLSRRIARAQRLQAGLGYKQGGPVPLGTRRLLVDEQGSRRFILRRGQYKALSTDRVVFTHGPPSEVALIRRVFEMYVEDGLSVPEITIWLKRHSAAKKNDIRWSRARVYTVLRSEIYTGIYVFGRKVNNLGRPRRAPSSEWVRSAAMEPMVSPQQFAAAADRLARNARRSYTDQEMKDGLVRLLNEKGYISDPLIRACPYVPTDSVYRRRFGSLGEACRQIGYSKAQRSSSYQRRGFTDAELVDELKRVYREHGTLTPDLISADDQIPSAEYILRRLGGLREVYKLVEIRTEDIPRPRPRRRTRPTTGDRSDAALIEGLRHIFAEHGYISSELINADPRVPSNWVYLHRFGSLYKAYAQAGYHADRTSTAALARARQAKREA